MHYTTQHLDLQISFRSAAVLRILQAIGLPVLFVPISLAVYVGMPAKKNNSIAGMVNFMRNIGSSFGTSMVTTLTARRAQVHQAYMVAHTTLGQLTFTQLVHALAARLTTAGLDATTATHQAYARLYRAVIPQASTLAYIDTFVILAVGAGIMFLLSFALDRNQPGAGAVAIG